jgi:putative spermidine/putrescine transport system substrate-binding protein
VSRRRPPRTRLAALLLVLVALTAACVEPTTADATPSDWDAVQAEARNQTVRWWMFSGDERANRFVDEHVAPAAEARGVTVQRVPVGDTVDAVQRVLAEVDAGRDEGSVDLIWINGENFALGKEAALWLSGWARELPNAGLVDWEDETIHTDFGVPVDGQSSPWTRGAFVFAHDPARTPEPPRSFEQLLAYARANPGRITYPAPPDFTGSAFVRQAVAALGEDEAFALLADLKPLQWRDGAAFPGSEAELNQLFGDGQVDLAMSYDPTFFATNVARGVFPERTRPFVLDSGTLQNTSYVTIPRNAANRAGALVVADLLLEPDLQAVLADPDVWGMPSVLDLDRLDEPSRAAIEGAPHGAHTLEDLGPRQVELPAERVGAVDARWREELRR